ncbi:MAG: DUF1700 domain-containing protein [Ruminococcus sp.]|nr:DUF1700 domain-containing protein [Ruminococcus sp.]
MTRADYMKTLAYNLRHLPKEDYDRAIEYFEEYFNEAGPEHEQTAIEDLGTPEEASRELIMDLAEKNIQEPPKTVKRGLHAVWIGILGVCAAPIALPMLLIFFCLIFMLVIVLFALLLSVFAAAVCTAAGGVMGIVGGAALTFRTFADGIATVGLGLVIFGLGILFVYGSFHLCRCVLVKMSQSLGNITKGGRRHENRL